MNTRAGAREKRFLDALKSIFTGAEVDGDSGFINLMRVKHRYFESIRPKLMQEINQQVKPDSPFREEMFDKLYTFFSRYFCESGSIYFRHIPAFSKIYERVYTRASDVELTWKTHMLYYVKSDILIRSMPVKLEIEHPPRRTMLFYFDASQVEHRQNNERREFIFEFSGTKRSPEGTVTQLLVHYSKNGRKTKYEEIIKAAKQASGARIFLTESDLKSAIHVFRKQTETDFFINKDARSFLREQFYLWLYQYVLQEDSIFEQSRLRQLQTIQKISHSIIDFIAQFEDELRRVWEKPKFVLGVNYVITIDKLQKLRRKISRHRGMLAQIKEWRNLGMVDEEFSADHLHKAAGNHRFLPLDTKHFKDMELDILGELGDLDEHLDGELICSENWQALNSLQARYKNAARCIYIDPPYNTAASEILYKNEYKNSSWLTLMENRIALSAQMIADNGVFIVAIDDAEMTHLSHLLDACFPAYDRNTVVVNHHPGGSGLEGTNISCTHEYAIFMTPKGHKKILRGERKDSGTTERGFMRAGTAASNLRIGRPNSFYAILVNPKTSEVMGAEPPPSLGDTSYPKESTPDGWVRLYPVGANGAERVWRRSYESFLQEHSRGNIICKNGKSLYLLVDETDRYRPVYSNWTDKKYNAGTYGSNLLTSIMGTAGTFSYPKSIHTVEDCIKSCMSKENRELVIDYFAGSGTTAHAVINLNHADGGNRKYLLVEMEAYFHSVLLPRIKKVIYAKNWKNGSPATDDGSSHFLKYYSLEQYEETLRKMHYSDSEQLELDSAKSPFEQYVFFGDNKFAHAIRLLKNGKLKIEFGKLYSNINIAESLSNILGKQIRRISSDTVVFDDDSVEKINPSAMTEAEKQHFIKLMRPYLWWGQKDVSCS